VGVSKSKVTALGEQLRSGEYGAEELSVLGDWRRGFEPALGEVVSSLAALEPVTGRSKTVNSIVDKLRRMPSTRLAQIEDIAGARMVREMNLDQQDALVADICEIFPDNKVYDRRVKPSSGYRAVHVVVRIGGVPVEVQIRTRVQDLWAQLVESLSDRWGQQIKYGGPPDEPDVPVGDTTAGDTTTRGAVVEMVVQRLSQSLRRIEEETAQVERRSAGLEDQVRQAYMEGRVEDLRDHVENRDALVVAQAEARQSRAEFMDSLIDLVLLLQAVP